MSNSKPDLRAFVVTQSGERSFFTEIGAAWKNKKAGYTIKLNAVPVNGEIVLLPPKAKNTYDKE